jgi:hypothetical protein
MGTRPKVSVGVFFQTCQQPERVSGETIIRSKPPTPPTWKTPTPKAPSFMARIDDRTPFRGGLPEGIPAQTPEATFGAVAGRELIHCEPPS